MYYPESLKSKVVQEIKSGKLNANQARKKYGIGGKMTIYNWLKQDPLSLNEEKDLSLLAMKPIDKNPDIAQKELEQEIKRLQKELKKVQLESNAYQMLIQIAEEKHGLDLGKDEAKQ